MKPAATIRSRRSPAPIARGGFTLIESLMAATILTLVVSGMIMPFTVAASNGQASARQVTANAMATELMEEILAKPIADPDDQNLTPGPDLGETAGSRRTFDNVDDYHGYSSDRGAMQGSQLIIWSQVEYITVAGQATSEAKTCRVTVGVMHKNTTLVTLTRLVWTGKDEKPLTN